MKITLIKIVNVNRISHNTVVDVDTPPADGGKKMLEKNKDHGWWRRLFVKLFYLLMTFLFHG
jgi:hypothetical protein